jgi:aminopeptidase N
MSKALPDHDYVKYAAPVRQLADLIGTDAVLGGLRSLIKDHMHGCVTKGEVIRSWSRASAQDLREWAAATLTPPADGGEAP